MKDSFKIFPFQDYLEHLPKAKDMGSLDQRFANVHRVYQEWKKRIEKELREKCKDCPHGLMFAHPTPTKCAESYCDRFHPKEFWENET